MTAEQFFKHHFGYWANNTKIYFMPSQIAAFAQAYAEHCEAERKKAAAETQRQKAAQIHNDGAEICERCGKRFSLDLFKHSTICEPCLGELTSKLNKKK